MYTGNSFFSSTANVEGTFERKISEIWQKAYKNNSRSIGCKIAEERIIKIIQNPSLE